jgi:hypothetical protein
MWGDVLVRRQQKGHDLDRITRLATLLIEATRFSRVQEETPTQPTRCVMLPPFIIDQIRRREEDEKRRSQLERPVLELPVDRVPPHAPRPRREEEDKPERGIVILELV